MNKTTKDGLQYSGWFIGGSALLIAALIIFSSMWIFGFGMFQRSTADFRGKTSQIEQTRANANYRIAAYNHFFDLCSAIQGDEGRLAAQRELLKSDDANRTIVATNIAALEGSRTGKIRQYNVDAAKADTLAHFQSSDLPFNIDPNQKDTKCANVYSQ